MYVVDTAPEIYKAFLLGYAYACGKRFSATFDENDKHDDKGRFAPKGQGSASGASNEEKQDADKEAPSISKPEDISGLIGAAHTGFKGDDAINKLIAEKNGHVPGAFHRNDIGDIDLIWGNDNIGLCHIIKRRSEEDAKSGRAGAEANLSKVLSGLTETIEKGQLVTSPRGNYEIWHSGNCAVVYPEFKKNKVMFVCTAYRRKKPPKY